MPFELTVQILIKALLAKPSKVSYQENEYVKRIIKNKKTIEIKLF